MAGDTLARRYAACPLPPNCPFTARSKQPSTTEWEYSLRTGPVARRARHGAAGRVRTVRSPESQARRVRGGLVGVLATVVTASAHAAAGGGLPSGSALIVTALACTTVGAALAGLRIDGGRIRVAGIVGALAVAQALGHVVLAVAVEHAHGVGVTPGMALAHLAGAVLLGLAVNAVEYLLVVCASVLCWLRLFAAAAHRAAVRLGFRATSDGVAQSILLRSGLGMRAPPRRVASAA